MMDPYLRSPAWRRRKATVLARCDWQCEARLEGCTGTATQVHHTSYEHYGNEPLWDLRGVCDACHAVLSAPPARRPVPLREAMASLLSDLERKEG